MSLPLVFGLQRVQHSRMPQQAAKYIVISGSELGGLFWYVKCTQDNSTVEERSELGRHHLASGRYPRADDGRCLIVYIDITISLTPF